MTDKRMAYWIDETCTNNDGHLYPCIAVEGEPGYHKTDWDYGTDIVAAERIVAKLNARLGHTELDVIEIIASSMRAQSNRERTRE